MNHENRAMISLLTAHHANDEHRVDTTALTFDNSGFSVNCRSQCAGML